MKITLLRLTLAIALASAMAVAPVTASAGIIPSPSVKIGSTKGTGPGGCVKSSKVVTFSVLGTGYSYPSTATVQLDGKRIASKAWTYAASAGPAVAPALTQSFTANVDLSKAKAGSRHALKLIGTFTVFDRRSGSRLAHAAATPTQTTATITKCAAPKKPAFTG